MKREQPAWKQVKVTHAVHLAMHRFATWLGDTKALTIVPLDETDEATVAVVTHLNALDRVGPALIAAGGHQLTVRVDPDRLVGGPEFRADEATLVLGTKAYVTTVDPALMAEAVLTGLTEPPYVPGDLGRCTTCPRPRCDLRCDCDGGCPPDIVCGCSTWSVRPCPKCGSDYVDIEAAYERDGEKDDHRVRFYCRYCNLTVGDGRWFDDPRQAVRAWNYPDRFA